MPEDDNDTVLYTHELNGERTETNLEEFNKKFNLDGVTLKLIRLKGKNLISVNSTFIERAKKLLIKFT